MARTEGIRRESDHGYAAVTLEDPQAVERRIGEAATVDRGIATNAILHGVTERNGALVHALALSAWSRSHKISSISSNPTERRIRSSVMPPASFSWVVNCWCVGDAG